MSGLVKKFKHFIFLDYYAKIPHRKAMKSALARPKLQKKLMTSIYKEVLMSIQPCLPND
ncbi:MAG: hypothetical protein GX432_02380 [Candidatus Atribacteria bacterium]|nr:hypothetical protein [Candidatus Atribacteria bacterium]